MFISPNYVYLYLNDQMNTRVERYTGTFVPSDVGWFGSLCLNSIVSVLTIFKSVISDVLIVTWLHGTNLPSRDALEIVK